MMCPMVSVSVGLERETEMSVGEYTNSIGIRWEGEWKRGRKNGKITQYCR